MLKSGAKPLSSSFGDGTRCVPATCAALPAADQRHDLDTVAVFQLALGMLAAGNDLLVDLDGDADRPQLECFEQAADGGGARELPRVAGDNEVHKDRF